MLKRITLLLTALGLLLGGAGCADKPGAQPVAMGRYVETDVLPKPYQGAFGLREGAQGQPALLAALEQDGEPAVEVATRTAKGGWAYTPFKDARELEVDVFAPGADGTILAAGGKGGVYRVNADGTSQALSLKPAPTQAARWLTELPDGRIIIAWSEGGAVVYDAKGEQKLAIPTGEAYAWAADSGFLYALTLQGEILRYGLQDGAQAEAIAAPAEKGGTVAGILSVDGQGALYLVDRGGIYRRVRDGSTWERLLDGAEYLLGDPSYSCGGMAAPADGGLYLLLVNTQTYTVKLMRYHWDDSIPARQDEELTVWAVFSGDSLRQAASILQNRRPGVKVTVRSAVDAQTSISTAEAVKALNTELLSGKGGDVLVMDQLNLQRYIDRGLLMDLSGWAQPYIQSGEWLSGVSATLADAQGRIFAVPSRFDVPMLWGKPRELSQFDGYSQWLEWVKAQGAERPAFASLHNAAFWFETLYPAREAQWLDAQTGKPVWDSPAFITFLEQVKALGNGYPALKENEIGTARGTAWEHVHQDRAALSLEQLYSFWSVTYGYSINRQRCEGLPGYVPFPADGGSVYIPRMVMAVNANTRHQALATEFLDILFSDQVQGLDFSDGFPVRIAGLDRLLEEQVGISKDRGQDGPVGQAYTSETSAPLSLYAPDEQTLRGVRAYIDAVDTPAAAPDAQLMAYMLEELQPFFDGQKTAQQAAQSLNKRLEAYLAE